MSHYEISYKGMSAEEADKKAIEDIKGYLAPRVVESFIEIAQTPEYPEKVNYLNFCFGLIGVRGFPVHAFFRTYCFHEYQEWISHEKAKAA